MNKFKRGDICIIRSNTSKRNGKIVKIVKYAGGDRRDIVTVHPVKPHIQNNEVDRSTSFHISEKSLVNASYFDLVRNMSDEDLEQLLSSNNKSDMSNYKVTVSYDMEVVDVGGTRSSHEVESGVVFARNASKANDLVEDFFMQKNSDTIKIEIEKTHAVILDNTNSGFMSQFYLEEKQI